MTKIVAFTGKRGSGKDTAAKTLIGAGYKLMAFAEPLREILKIVYGLTDEELNDTVLKEKVLERFPWRSPRDLMTTIGTQGFRDLIHQETWVRALERRALQHELVGVTDLRFLTEEAMLKENNAVIIRIINPNRKDDDDTSKHRSETEMDSIIATHEIINDGTIEELHAKVRTVLDIPVDYVAASNDKGRMGIFMKTTPIRAIQLRWENWSEICTFMGGIIGPSNPGRSVDTYSETCGNTEPFIEISIPTLEGVMTARHGDWIAKGPKGEYWAIKPDIFRATYAPVTA
jgi:Dephospho-CoA kinase